LRRGGERTGCARAGKRKEQNTHSCFFSPMRPFPPAMEEKVRGVVRVAAKQQRRARMQSCKQGVLFL